MRAAAIRRPAFAGYSTCGVALAAAVLAVGCGASTNPPGSTDGGFRDAAGGGRDGAADAAVDGSMAGTGGANGSGGRAVGTGGLGTGGAGTGGTPGSGGAGGSSPPTCTVTLSRDPVPEAAPGAKVRIHATVSSAATATPRWAWSVFSYPASGFIDWTPVTGDPATVEFPVSRPGQYSVHVTVSIAGTSGCSVQMIIDVYESCPACFRFRMRPRQVDGIAVPLQEQDRIDVKKTSVVHLADGFRVLVTPMDTRHSFLNAYVRIIGADPALAIEGFTLDGRPLDAYWREGMTYQVLVVPSTPLAPQVFRPGTTEYIVDDGTFVTGRATDSAGTAVGKTQVLLRAGILPSTIGVADPRGNFNLQARPGVLSAVIVPPPEAGLPEARIPASRGVALGNSNNGAFLKMEWAPVSRSALAVTVSSPAGAAVLGAHVRAESVAELAAVGHLDVYGSEGDAAPMQTLSATGAVSVDFTTDATGLARFPALPEGDYRLIVAPPSGSTAGTLTTVMFSKTAGDQTTTIALAVPVTLNGTLMPGAEVAGARVVARDLGTGFVADDSVAVVGDGGRFSLRVAPSRTYSLVAESPPGGGFARTVLAPPIAVGPEAIQTLLGNMTIARAQPFKLTAKLGDVGVAGILVQVFCPPSSTSCLDPTLPLAEAVTDVYGSFTVRLPVTDP